MTENEAIRDLQYLIGEYSAYPPETGVNETIGSLQYCISALKEIQQYREIGTAEECREAMEKQNPKKPVKDKYHHNCCPNCGWIVSGEGGYGEEFCPHCENCGQKIDFGGNGMIKIELEPWEESDIKASIVERISNTIISREFKLYGDIPDEGCYTPYDKFKNYVANLVADRIFEYMIENPEIRKRIDTAIDKAEESIVATVVKNRGAGEQDE